MCGHRPGAADKFRPTLCSVHSKTFHRPYFTVGGCWNKSLHLQPLQLWYCEKSGSACVMRRNYSITYMHPFSAINGLIVVGRVGNLLYGYPSYWLELWIKKFDEGYPQVKLQGNSPKMQFFIFVIINNFRLSSFIFLNLFLYSGHTFANTWSFKALCIRGWAVLVTLKIDFSPFLFFFSIFHSSKCSTRCNFFRMVSNFVQRYTNVQ